MPSLFTVAALAEIEQAATIKPVAYVPPRRAELHPLGDPNGSKKKDGCP